MNAKRYRVTGLDSRNRANYRWYFETLEQAETAYVDVMQRKAVKFVLLFDQGTEKLVKSQAC